ncbi:hypothetical protein DL96DRAFT_1696102 [Flagelloscypha sp. PMI_526]|nr:hypothetical protein DL96DRAFT_1696102 [Flagelloscypha sp. PMI_526]
MHFQPGTAPIKAEYLLSLDTNQNVDDDAAEGATSHTGRRDASTSGQQIVAVAGGQAPRKKLTKEEKKAFRGSNTDRRYTKVREKGELCWRIAANEICTHGDKCRFSHDITAYLDSREPDIPLHNELVFCPEYSESGKCRFGFKCRFVSAHMGPAVDGNDLPTILIDEEKQKDRALHTQELNYVDFSTLKQLRSRKYATPITDDYLISLGEQPRRKGKQQKKKATPTTIVFDEPDQEDEPMPLDDPASSTIEARTGDYNSDAHVDAPDVPSRFVEKKRLHWQDKTYLAPLTTVGNLPFRRLCVSYGCDITCGEMALATSLMSGSKEEWSLLRRHPSERTFGIQVAGNNAGLLGQVSEVIGKECGSGIDFVDLNCGCPIDLVVNAGSGSALLEAVTRLTKGVIGMNKALGDIPVTVKLRTGVKEANRNAHKLMPRLDADCGAACLTLHGRTRQQRYKNLADWDYVKTCVEAVRTREEEEGFVFFDVLYQYPRFLSSVEETVSLLKEYWHHMDTAGVDGVMLGRGALIKPWIFTEVKERREWDISARERLDGIQKVSSFLYISLTVLLNSIYHFGSDTAGINTSRRYLCEALSFQYRYVPIGILETLPARINDRAPSFRGRDDLETLLASPKSSDWVKISEMFPWASSRLMAFYS